MTIVTADKLNDTARALAAGVVVEAKNGYRKARRGELIRECRSRGFDIAANQPGDYYRALLLRRVDEDAVIAEAEKIKAARKPEVES